VRASDSCEAPWSIWRDFADRLLGVFTFQLTPDCSTAPTALCHSLRPQDNPSRQSLLIETLTMLFRRDVSFAQAVRAVIAPWLLFICLKIRYNGEGTGKLSSARQCGPYVRGPHAYHLRSKFHSMRVHTPSERPHVVYPRHCLCSQAKCGSLGSRGRLVSHGQAVRIRSYRHLHIFDLKSFS
jgi:hypothetical protein